MRAQFFDVEIRTPLSRLRRPPRRTRPNVAGRRLAAWLQSRRRMRRRLGLGAVLAAAFLFCSAEAGFDPAEFDCEEAVKHLLDCCPQNSVAVEQVSCYLDRGCGSARPDLPDGQAVCLRDMACDRLRAIGACEDPVRAARAP